MAYHLYDAKGNRIRHHDLEDKTPWCIKGAAYEEVFVQRFGSQLNLTINPGKKEDPCVPDLLNTKTGNLADLKVQNTPFFQAKKRFGIDPQYTVVFNYKDKCRYERLYPDIEVYFWIDWVAVRFTSDKDRGEITVEPMAGVWFITFKDLLKILEKAPLHSYYRREHDTQGNARSSYVISLEEPCFLKVV